MAILTTNKFKLNNLSSLTRLTGSDVLLAERYDTSRDDYVHFSVNQDQLARSTVSCLHFSSGKGVGDLSAIDYLSVQYVNGGFSSLLTCVPTSRGILSAAEYSNETHVLSLLFNALDSEYGLITVDLGSLVDVYGGDANSELGLSSIYLQSNGNVFELFNFHEDNYTADDLSSIIENNHLSTYDVLLKHKDSNSKHILEYMPLSSILYNGEIGNTQVSGDANVIPNAQNTITTVEDQQGNKWHQLYRVGTEDPSIQVSCSFHSYDSEDYNYLLNEGNLQPNPEKQFVVYNQQTKRLEYVDVGLHIPKVKASDLDDDVLPEISTVIIPEVSSIISAELSALDDKYWIKDEDETENYGSAIGNSQETKVIDLDNKELVGQWRTDDDFTCGTNISCDKLMAGSQVTISQGGLLQIGSTTLTETQLQQLLALLDA